MKITLHDSIPKARRPEVEAAVKKLAGDCRIFWMPSRFPRIVMLVEPEAHDDAAPEGGSFFETSGSDQDALALTTEALEATIKSCLAIGTPS